MQRLELGVEIKYVFIQVVYFLLVISLTSSHDEHYNLRIKIPKWMRALFFNHVKSQTVPMISFVTAIQFYVSLVVLSIISFVNEFSLTGLLFKYLFIPFFAVQLIAFIVDAIVGYRRKRINEKLSREAYLNKIHSQNKKSKTKRKKRRK